MSDTNTEKQLPRTEEVLKISLKITERVSDGAVGMSAEFNEVDTNLLVQGIAYMLDTAFKDNEKATQDLADIVPAVVKKYIELKHAQDVPEEELIELTTLPMSDLVKMIKESSDDDELVFILAEIARRGLDGNGEGN